MAVSIRLAKASLSYDDRAIEKRVGLILLATDQSSEADFARLVGSKQIGIDLLDAGRVYEPDDA